MDNISGDRLKHELYSLPELAKEYSSPDKTHPPGNILSQKKFKFLFGVVHLWATRWEISINLLPIGTMRHYSNMPMDCFFLLLKK
jgi:hypothetical protein